MSRYRSLRALAGGVTLAGVALLAGAAPALAAPADVTDVVPAPAPTAPPIASSADVAKPGDVLNRYSDLAPAGLPVTGLVQSVVGTTKIIPG